MAKSKKANKIKSYQLNPIDKDSFDIISNDRKKRKTLILCEGPTEVNYFQGIIKSNTYGNNCKFVLPTQTQYNSSMQILLTAIQILKLCFNGNKKKIEELDIFINENQEHLSLENDEELRKRLIKIDDIIFKTPFEEIWLVFDADDRLNSVVFEKAKEISSCLEIGIYIAFSNRQWENWVLLHFEQTLHTSSESDCKKNCTTTCHLESDRTQNCLIGYLQGKNYHPNYSKGGAWTKQIDRRNDHCFEGLLPANTNFQKPLSLATEKIAFDKIKTAITNSLWLYEQQNFPKPENSENPYTDVAILVALLMNEPLVWGHYEIIEDKRIINYHDFIIEYLSVDTTNSKISIRITNSKNSSIIMNSHQLEKFNIIEEKLNQKNFLQAINITPVKILYKNESEVFEIAFISSFNTASKLRYQIETNTFLIIEP